MTQNHKNNLEILLTISNYVGSVMELDDILKIIVEQTSIAMGVPVCSVYLFASESDRELALRSSHGLNPDIVGKARFKKGEGLPGWAVEHGEILALSDAPKDPRFKPLMDSNEEQFHAYLCAPLRIQEEIVGCMTTRKKEIYKFTEDEITLFETICKQVAIVIEKSRLYFQKVNAEKMAIVSISLSEIAHYIKNILQSMRGGSWFVERGLQEEDLEKAKNGWKLLDKSTKKISNLVENMLNYSRSTNLRPERGNINALVLDILQSLLDTAKERNIEIQPELSQKIPDIYFDWDRLHDSFLNLFTNALDAIPEDRKGLVIVKSRYDKEKKRVVVEIIDNGQGVPEENKEKIFHMFFSTKGRLGTGIGLSVTKKIIEEHSGRIWFESGENEGTRFVVELPA
ncbi:GAF domain-containing sensor histidine kinase [Candidatus Sumerlaeota bacterium]|nr:GAF domain-containing sensor histidine kinase [Candidatus Sumerlaeota bacterium]